MKVKDINRTNGILDSIAMQQNQLALPKIPTVLTESLQTVANIQKQILGSSFYEPALTATTQNAWLFSGMTENMLQIQNMIAPVIVAQPIWQDCMEPLRQYQSVLQKASLYIDPIMRLRSFLLRNYWTVMDDELIEELSELPNIESATIESAILNYYTKNDFEKINKLWEKYQQDEEVAQRAPIFIACFEAMKNLPPQTAAQIVIPTLLAQTSYFYDTLYQLIPEAEKEKIKEQLKSETSSPCPFTNGKKPKTCKHSAPHQPHLSREIFLQHLEQTASYLVYRTYTEVISKTFAGGTKADKQKEKEHYSKYRNKILHGEERAYGTTENMIRSWLELIFLFDLRKNYRENEKRILPEISGNAD